MVKVLLQEAAKELNTIERVKRKSRENRQETRDKNSRSKVKGKDLRKKVANWLEKRTKVQTQSAIN